MTAQLLYPIQHLTPTGSWDLTYWKTHRFRICMKWPPWEVHMPQRNFNPTLNESTVLITTDSLNSWSPWSIAWEKLISQPWDDLEQTYDYISIKYLTASCTSLCTSPLEQVEYFDLLSRYIGMILNFTEKLEIIHLKRLSCWSLKSSKLWLIDEEDVVLWLKATFEALFMVFGSSSMILRGVA